MEEESRKPQVLSSPISSICAVISNYWSLIEVHVEYSPSLFLSRQMNTRHSPITQSDTPGDPTCHLNLPLQAYSFLSFPPPSVWENSWHPLMSDWPRTGSPSLLHLTGYLFMLFSGRWNHFLYGTMLQIPIMGFLHCFLTPKITEMLRLFGPWNTFFCICQKDPQIFRDKRIHQNALCIPRWNLYLFSICQRIILVYYNLSFIFVMLIYSLLLIICNCATMSDVCKSVDCDWCDWSFLFYLYISLANMEVLLCSYFCNVTVSLVNTMLLLPIRMVAKYENKTKLYFLGHSGAV